MGGLCCWVVNFGEHVGLRDFNFNSRAFVTRADWLGVYNTSRALQMPVLIKHALQTRASRNKSHLSIS